jgi:hypothetical protein
MVMVTIMAMMEWKVMLTAVMKLMNILYFMQTSYCVNIQFE